MNSKIISDFQDIKRKRVFWGWIENMIVLWIENFEYLKLWENRLKQFCIKKYGSKFLKALKQNVMISWIQKEDEKTRKFLREKIDNWLEEFRSTNNK